MTAFDETKVENNQLTDSLNAMTLKVIDGQKADQVNKVVEMIFAPFTPGVTDIPDHETILFELRKLDPKGDLSLASSQTSLLRFEK